MSSPRDQHSPRKKKKPVKQTTIGQMQLMSTDKPKSAVEKAKSLTHKIELMQKTTKVANSLTMEGLFGLNQKMSLLLDVELSKQLKTEKEIEKINTQIGALQNQSKQGGQYNATQERMLKAQLINLQAKISAAASMKESKFDVLKERVMDEIQRKFQFSKVNYRFKQDLHKDALNMFQNAEKVNYEIENLDLMKAVDMKVDDNDEEQKKKKEDAIKELEKKKKINELEHEEMTKSEHYGLLLFDDLKFASVGRYKLYQKEDWEKGDLIKDFICRRRSIRRAVLDEDISDLSDIEENFNERNARIKAGEMKPRRKKVKKPISEKSSSRSSDAMSSFDSEASRVNFWKDINTKDDMYRQAIVITKDDKDKEKNNPQVIGEESPLQDQKDRDFALEIEKNKARISKAIPQQKGDRNSSQGDAQTSLGGGIHAANQKVLMLQKQLMDNQMFERKMDRMKQAFEITKRNIKKVALDYAVNYFKDKSVELSSLFTNETLKLLNQYTQIRNDSLQKDRVIMNATKIVEGQESIISELRQFIEEQLTPILELVEREKHSIMKNYKKQKGRPLPGSIKGDPFAMFALYFSQKEKEEQEEASAKDQVRDLEGQIDALKSELKVVHDASDLLLKDGLALEQQIRTMKTTIDNLEYDLREERSRAKREISKRDQIIEEMSERFEKERENLINWQQIESKVNHQIQIHLSRIIDTNRTQLRQVKNVLRTPRLYEQYRRQFLKAGEQKVLVNYIVDQLKKDKRKKYSKPEYQDELTESFISKNQSLLHSGKKGDEEFDNLLNLLGDDADDLHKAIYAALRISLSNTTSPRDQQKGAGSEDLGGTIEPRLSRDRVINKEAILELLQHSSPRASSTKRISDTQGSFMKGRAQTTKGGRRITHKPTYQTQKASAINFAKGSQALNSMIWPADAGTTEVSPTSIQSQVISPDTNNNIFASAGPRDASQLDRMKGIIANQRWGISNQAITSNNPTSIGSFDNTKESSKKQVMSLNQSPTNNHQFIKPVSAVLTRKRPPMRQSFLRSPINADISNSNIMGNKSLSPKSRLPKTKNGLHKSVQQKQFMMPFNSINPWSQNLDENRDTGGINNTSIGSKPGEHGEHSIKHDTSATIEQQVSPYPSKRLIMLGGESQTPMASSQNRNMDNPSNEKQSKARIETSLSQFNKKGAINPSSKELASVNSKAKPTQSKPSLHLSQNFVIGSAPKPSSPSGATAGPAGGIATALKLTSAQLSQPLLKEDLKKRKNLMVEVDTDSLCIFDGTSTQKQGQQSLTFEQIDEAPSKENITATTRRLVLKSKNTGVMKDDQNVFNKKSLRVASSESRQSELEKMKGRLQQQEKGSARASKVKKNGKAKQQSQFTSQSRGGFGTGGSSRQMNGTSVLSKGTDELKSPTIISKPTSPKRLELFVQKSEKEKQPRKSLQSPAKKKAEGENIKIIF